MDDLFRARRILHAVAALAVVVVAGTIGFRYILDDAWLQAVYRAVITISLAGLDLTPRNDAARLLSIFLVLSGLTIFGYVVTVLVEAIARGVVAGAVVERRRRRLIERLEDHVINDDAIQAADERGDLYVVGNATNEGDLRTAGLERVLKPQVAAFLDAVSTPGGSELRFEEIEVDETCEPAGQESGEIGVRDRTGAVIVALLKSEGDFDATPSPDVRLEPGDHIIAVGTPDELRALEELFAPQEAVAR